MFFRKKIKPLDVLMKTIDCFTKETDCSTHLYVASILATVAGCLNDPQNGHTNISRIADFTGSLSRERIAQIESERRNK